MFLGTLLILSSNRPLHGYNGPLGERSEIILRLPSSGGLTLHQEGEAVVFLKSPFLLWDHVEDKRNTKLEKTYFKKLQV